MMRLGKSKREELLSAYLDGELEERERAKLESRLEADPSLRAELEALRRTVALVRELPPAPLPRNFLLSPEMAVRPRRERRPVRRLVAVPRMALSTLVVGLLFVAVLLGDVFTRQPPMAVPVVTVEPQAAAATEIPAEESVVMEAEEGPAQNETKAERQAESLTLPTVTFGGVISGTASPTPPPTPAVVTAPPPPAASGTEATGTRLWWRVAEVVLGAATLILAGASLLPPKKED